MQQVREVYSLLMPLADGRVVVPRAAIAEVLGFTRPKDRPANAPEFLLGFIDWQGQRIPLVSLEAARGKPAPTLGRRTRIAVVFGFGGRLKPDVFALVTQGYPYLVRVNENVLQPEAMEAEEELILARVRMANEKPFIPDLEALEERIVAALGDSAPMESPAPADEIDALANVAGEDDDPDAAMFAADAGMEEGEATMELPEAEDIEVTAGEAVAEGIEPEITADEANEIELDVTGFGGETDYSAELDELASALDEETATGVELDLSALEASAEDEEITIEGFELDTEDDAGEIDLSALVGDDGEEEKEEADAPEFDLSDLELLDDDDKQG